jgi:hypothetical protein
MSHQIYTLPPGKAEELLQDAIKHPENYSIGACCLCKSVAAFIGLFFPTEEFAKRLGQPHNKERYVVYGLCERCQEISENERNAHVEKHMLTELGVQ